MKGIKFNKNVRFQRFQFQAIMPEMMGRLKRVEAHQSATLPRITKMVIGEGVRVQLFYRRQLFPHQ